jgi:hypothetical protein
MVSRQAWEDLLEEATPLTNLAMVTMKTCRPFEMTLKV